MVLFLFLVYYGPLLLSTLKTSMEPVNLGYSTKNIPIAKPTEYLKCLIDKTDSFLRRVRWKAYHFLNPTEHSTTKTYGFPTTKSPPPIKELNVFEDKMLKLIQNIEFKKDKCEFQKQLSQDTSKIKADAKMYIPADKTTNYYRLNIKRCKAYKSSSKRCNLCLHEKFLIICHPELGTLNSRNELISACRHRKKHLLANF